MALDRERIEKSVRKIRQILKNEPRRPSPDQIHDLRTHSRRFEAAVQALAIDSKKNERRLLRKLSLIRKRAGRVRDMDVLTGHASHLHIEKQEDCLVQLLEHLGWERYQYADRLHGAMRQYGPPLRRRLKRTARRIEKLIPSGGKDPSNGVDRVTAEATAAALELTSELKNPPALKRSNLHPYRLKVKALRNVLQMAENGNEDFINILGEVKDAIGEWHDWEELIAIARDLLQDAKNCAVMRALKATSQKKYENALALANRMRREYLRIGGMRKGSGVKMQPIRPVLEAAEAIAS